jgi:hypothetical protein
VAGDVLVPGAIEGVVVHSAFGVAEKRAAGSRRELDGLGAVVDQDQGAALHGSSDAADERFGRERHLVAMAVGKADSRSIDKGRQLGVGRFSKGLDEEAVLRVDADLEDAAPPRLHDVHGEIVEDLVGEDDAVVDSRQLGDGRRPHGAGIAYQVALALLERGRPLDQTIRELGAEAVVGGTEDGGRKGAFAGAYLDDLEAGRPAARIPHLPEATPPQLAESGVELG